MGELKATPGPWLKVEGKAFVYALDENGTNVFQTHVEGAHCPACELDANAHLIAAAPELYEALANIENDDGSIPKTIWDMRNAALAKSRGEQP